MKKSLFIILMVCLALVGLVSCKNEIEPAQEELVSVSFDNGTSRALTATLEEFDMDEYYWSYEAQKNDGSGLRSGETAWDTTGEGSVAVQSGKGLDDDNDDPVKVPGFSKGYWNFRLFAYKDAGRTELAYWGEADLVLIDSTHHEAKVTVSPVSGGNGYLKVGTITFVPAASISVPTDLVIYTDEVLELEGSAWVPVSVQPEGGIYTLPAKQYKFSREYSFDGIPVANGSVIVTIYSNLTTTVSGTLSELTTYAEFKGEQNPDIVRETLGSAVVTTGSTTAIEFHRPLDPAPSTTAKVSSATMPAAAAVAKLTELSQAVGADDTSSSSLKLNLNVDTTEVKPQSVTYDIGMEAVLTYMKNQTQSVAKSDVKNVDDYVIVVIDLASDIADVSVTHSGVAMIKYTNYDEFLAADVGDDVLVPATATSESFYKGFYCLRTVGEARTLNIKTRSFSPFEVTYQMTKYVAAIGEKKYTTLATAADAAIEGQTIILLDDITFGEDYSVAVWNKAFNLDLNGHTITTNSEVGWSLSNNGYKASAICFSIENTGSQHTVVVSNGTINTRYGAGIYADGAELNLTIKNVSIHQNHESYVQTTDEYSSAVRLTSGAKVTIEGSTLEGRHAVAVSNSGGDVVINGGTVKSDLFFSTGSDSGVSKTITIKDGDFTNFSVVNDDKGTVSITGGTYNIDPSKYVATGYLADYDSQIGKWIIIKEGDFVATVTHGTETTGYYSLEKAFEHAQNEDTVTLLKNVSVGAEIVIDKTITLDLNGNTITGTQNEEDTTIFRIGDGSSVTGNLTIIGTTKGSAINAKAIAVSVKANSELTVNGGSYSNSYYNDNNHDPKTNTHSGNYVFDIDGAKGAAAINNVTLTGFVKGIRARGSDTSVTVSNSSADVIPGPVTGDFVGYGWGLFCADGGATLTVNGGSYKTTYAIDRQMIDAKAGTVKIKAGSFETDYDGEGDAPALVVINKTGANLEIEGGTFKYSGDLVYDHNIGNDNFTVSITGGTYSKDPNENTAKKYVADGYMAVAKETTPETWVVEKVETWLDYAVTTWYEETKSSFEIGTAAELAGVSKLVLEGKSFRGKTILLTADIDLSAHVWIPIGNGTFSFQGSVDGQTHDIIGLKNGTKDMLPESVLSAWSVTQIGNEGIPYGFIGTIGSTTDEGDPITITISNVDFVGVDINIDYANFIGVVFAADTAAAKVGSDYINPSLKDNISLSKVTVSGTIKSTNMSGSTVGGVVGKLYTLGTLSVDQCTNNASFTITSNSKLGGIVGSKSLGTMSVSNCINNGNFLVNKYATDLTKTTSIGGIAVLWNGTGEITGCTNNGKMTNELSGVNVYSSSIGHIALNNNGKMTFIDNAVGTNASGWDCAYQTNGTTKSDINFSGKYENTGSGWVITSAN